VNANSIHSLDLKASTFQLVDEPAKRGRGIGARKDVFVHEETPDKILILPALTQTGNLKEEDTIVIQHVIDLLEEGREVANTNVLGHLQASNFVVATLRNRNVAVVHAKDLALLLRDAGLAESIVAPGSLVATESDAGHLGTVVHTGKTGKGPPTTADIKQALTLLELDLLADNSKLVILELLQSLFLVDVADDATSVNHTRAKKPGIEVIAAVVVIAHLLLVCTRASLARPIGADGLREIKTYPEIGCA